MTQINLTTEETKTIIEVLSNFYYLEQEEENPAPVTNLLGEQVFNSNKELVRGVIKRLEEEGCIK